jgi:hypothetical protein
VHTDLTLDALDKALDTFHAVKDGFVKLNVHKDFNFPKLRALQHYSRSIQLLGAADGFNTKASERLHIDYAKVAFCASNKHHYVIQMTTWLRCQEAVEQYLAYLEWLNTKASTTTCPLPSESGALAPQTPAFCASHQSTVDTQLLLVGAEEGIPQATDTQRKKATRDCTPPQLQQGDQYKFSIAKKAAFVAKPAAHIVVEYNAPNFIADVSKYLKKMCPRLPAHKLPKQLDWSDVYRQMTVYLPGQLYTGNVETRDWIGSAPARPHCPGHPAQAPQFDTVLVTKAEVNKHTAGTALEGITSQIQAPPISHLLHAGLCATQLCIIFVLPCQLQFKEIPSHFGYIPWFIPFLLRTLS